MSDSEFPLVQFMREGFDPVAELASIRADHPVYPMEIPGGQTVYLVTRYHDVRSVLGDHERFSNDFGNVIGLGSNQEDPGGLGFRDPPEHTRLRRYLTPEFTVRRLRRMEPRIEALVEEYLDKMEAAGPPADLVESFALPIPSLVVCELLGVPYEERADFLRISTNRFDLTAGPEASLQAVNDAMTYLTDLVARERLAPGEGLLGQLLREHGDELDDRTLASMADGLLTGGHDTSTSMLSLGTLWLLENPEQAAKVREVDGHVNEVVEELLRYMTVVQVAFPRFAREDLELHGHTVKKGEMVLCSLSAANRDPNLGDDMDQVKPHRETAGSHLAFGHGIHRCIGAPLAQMEMRIAFPALLRRFPGLRVAGEVPFRALSIVHGVEKLPVAW
ncbi:cytochrome P450 [Nonomuraea roseoviolacea subsp. roseoviolacea]|uniref:Cytochrome P450 n=1 Tax=Nonomuraea roseoviolacea subsp. carminata TaxID=160689 RepID=A0ABT1K9N2_9ACTN|nr:cytochrome P450 [Nonomuraea roseoviolacea]MCP2350681.1 cytochrome P450 [Nonomuraea roseoviolacea subsp. carminata]